MRNANPKRMKRLLTVLILFFGLAAKAQYNNEWIDYSKTYFKFKVGANGLYRIGQSVLQAAGLDNVPAEQFQLWRNGEQVPLYTSIPAGLLGGSDFIEFYGRMNDGKPDNQLYQNSGLQPSDKWSLLTDTAAFFLTVNPSGGNLRIVSEDNDVAGNALPAEPYFMYTQEMYYRDRINPGFAAVVGEYVYSSLYDKGEGWSSAEFRNSSPLISRFSNLNVYPGGPDATIKMAASGNALNGRIVRLYVNGNKVIEQAMDFFNTLTAEATVPLTYLGKPTDTVRIANGSTNNNDRMVVSYFTLTYPRKFNFENARLFQFELPANLGGNYLEISNFNAGSASPILYDLTNNKRYVGNTGAPGLVRFALAPSAADRKLVLLNAEAGGIFQVGSLTTRNFTNFGDPANQGNYLIISSSRLFNGSAGNPVEAYRQYRSSAAGGGYDAKFYDIDQLIDQFAFGIKKHPLSVKNFLRYARNSFTVRPAFVFLMGRGLTYDEYRRRESSPVIEDLNMIPTFGFPASDNILASDGYDAVAETPVGRLAAINGVEAEQYLEKVKQYELALSTAPSTIQGRAWMKNVVHAIGGSDPYLQAVILGYMNAAGELLKDTSFGAQIYNFSKNSAFAVQQLTSAQLQALFKEGINLITYFGHSSANTLEFNLDDPQTYDNQGKYPVFVVNGCNAGNFFIYDTLRLTGATSSLTLSEKYVLANQRGSIAFLASTHFGIVNYLNIYTYGLYTEISGPHYGETLGQIQRAAIAEIINVTGATDYYGRVHAEEITLHGDPAIKMYSFEKPDYVVEDQQVKISPSFISVADNSFKVNVKFYNIGKAVSDSIVLEIKRQLPDGSTVTLLSKRVTGIRNMDSVLLTIPINPLTDKGTNKIIVTVDANQEVTETSEANNTVTKEFLIIEDEARPVSPHNFSIINKSTVPFFASIANPFSLSKNYVMEVDTTELFNSSLKVSQTLTSAGGILEFTPTVNFLDSTVYYWRVSAVPASGGDYQWNTSSFTVIKNGTPGFGQAHYYQYQKNDYEQIDLDDFRTFDFQQVPRSLGIKVGLAPYFNSAQNVITLDENRISSATCAADVIKFVVLDSASLKVMPNYLVSPGQGRFGSLAPCGAEISGFSFYLEDTTYRRRAMNFIDSIPAGQFVIIYWRGIAPNSNTAFVAQWMADTARLGSGVSLYHKMLSLGLTEIDSFTHSIPFFFFMRKGRTNYPIYQAMGKKADDYLEAKFILNEKLNYGTIETPLLGPALEWKEFHWKNKSIEQLATDSNLVELYGFNYTGQETKLATIRASDTTLSFVNAADYPFLKLKLITEDTVSYTPTQLKWWLLNGTFTPEGTVAPNIYFQSKDTLEAGEPLDFKLAFKNISENDFRDSMEVRMVITRANNAVDTLVVPRFKKLNAGDTLTVANLIDTRNYPGPNTLFVDVNPDFAQPEQYRFNNFLFRNFYVRDDRYAPTLDVTFDGVHILNRDIVSAKPHILIKLKDNSKYLALNDTSLLKVQVRYPDGSLKSFGFNSDTLRFTPANLSPGGADNTATVDFNPYFLEDGEYELIVSGNDVSGNNAGPASYRVVFSIINKPMISNLLNYPNPFTTSTAFVFTVTGSEVPQNIRIQILTITGKIVREITKEELGPIHVGRNITEFKWDGTDQYGQKLANGVYLYRVITNLNGKSLDKYKAEGDNTDKYFNNGYGKMYLMR